MLLGGGGGGGGGVVSYPDPNVHNDNYRLQYNEGLARDHI